MVRSNRGVSCLQQAVLQLVQQGLPLVVQIVQVIRRGHSRCCLQVMPGLLSAPLHNKLTQQESLPPPVARYLQVSYLVGLKHGEEKSLHILLKIIRHRDSAA